MLKFQTCGLKQMTEVKSSVFCVFCLLLTQLCLGRGRRGGETGLLSLGTGCVSQNWYLCLAASSMFLAGPWHADNSSIALWISCNFCMGMVAFYNGKDTQTQNMRKLLPNLGQVHVALPQRRQRSLEKGTILP